MSLAFGSSDQTINSLALAEEGFAGVRWTHRTGWAVESAPTSVGGTIHLETHNRTYALTDRLQAD